MNRHTWAAVASVGAMVISACTRAAWAREPDATKPAPAAAGAGASGVHAAASADDLARCAAAADYSEAFAGRVVLVMKKGEVIFERAGNGWSLDKPHPLASGTKSFTGVMAMMAVQDGLLTLDELASDTITEWKSDPLKSKITVRHLLTLSSGLAPSDKVFAGGSGANILGDVAKRRAERLGTDDADRVKPKDNFKAAIDLPMNHAPGTKFEYGPSHFYAFGELLQRKLQASDLPQKTVMAYLMERVWNPLGIEVARIGRDAAGNPNLPGGALLTAREWAEFGRFALNQGSVKQTGGEMKPLLKPDLLAECFKPSSANPTYGLTWWLRSSGGEADTGGALGAPADGASDNHTRNRLRQRVTQRLRERRQGEQNQAVQGPDGQPIKVYMAAGLGKQRLYVLPQYDLVVVRFAEGAMEGQRFDDRAFLGALLGLDQGGGKTGK